jgi:hypothetical protein
LQDVVQDLQLSNPLNRSPHRRDVVLPDGVHNLRGYVKPPTADVVAALSPGGKHHGIPTGVMHSAGGAGAFWVWHLVFPCVALHELRKALVSPAAACVLSRNVYAPAYLE